MADTGWVTVGTIANDTAVGTLAWASLPSARISDDAYASAQNATASAVSSNYLKGTNLGLAIPAGATIDGIEVRFEVHKANNFSVVTSNAVRIVKGGVTGALNLAAGETWTLVDAFLSYGGPTTLWGKTWTDVDVNSTNFGAVIQAQVGGINTARCDSFQIKVYYTVIPQTDLFASLYTDPDTFGNSTVYLAVQFLTGVLAASANTFGASVVIPAPWICSPALITNIITFGNAFVRPRRPKGGNTLRTSRGGRAFRYAMPRSGIRTSTRPMRPRTPNPR